MPAIRHFRDLRTYQKAVREVRHIYELSLTLPPREQHRLADQMIRASRAVPALIAEAWARRYYQKAFRDKLSQALGESMEVQVWLECAAACGYIPDDTFQELDAHWQDIGGMIRRMMQESAHFTGKGEKKGIEQPKE